MLGLALKKNDYSEMPLKKVKLEPVGELEIPVDEPNENNTVDLEVQECSSGLDCCAPAEIQNCEVYQEWMCQGWLCGFTYFT